MYSVKIILMIFSELFFLKKEGDRLESNQRSTALEADAIPLGHHP